MKIKKYISHWKILKMTKTASDFSGFTRKVQQETVSKSY
tara:strand:+ start:46982 stop:47098 length:117 start_codon:yes stop_codon:yes gene_type:complete